MGIVVGAPNALLPPPTFAIVLKLSVPPLTVVFPEYEFDPDNVNVPAPVFVRLPAPIIAVVDTVTLPGAAPDVSMVRALPPLSIPPVNVNVDAVALVS